MKIAKEGLVFILPSLCLAALFFIAGWWPLGILFGLFTAAFVFFFRNPSRTPPEGEHLIVSPADGKVLRIDDVSSHPDIPGPAKRVCIFLSLYDVHLTRAPLSGTVASAEYHPGKFFPAYRDEASELNESNSLLIRGDRIDVALKQIVGVAARRIKCFVRAGDRVRRGGIIGLMYFGSRVELVFPPGVTIKAGIGQKVRAGESVIAEVKP
jgi:phosphatidylserine decarboxylase